MKTIYQRQVTTWYHLPAMIRVSASHFHLVRIPWLPLPHPGVVNWVVRRGLPLQTRLELTALHEFGHLQTLPVPLLHLLVMLWPRRRGHSPSPLWARVLMILLSHQVTWEVASESYLLAHDRRAYRALPDKSDKVRYAIFWGSMAVFSLVSTWWLARRPLTKDASPHQWT